MDDYPGIADDRPRARRGQAITELCLLAPILILLFIGVIDLGRAFHTAVAASNSGRVGLIYAQQVVTPRVMGCTTCQFITVGDVISQTINEAQGGVNAADMQVSVCLQDVSECPVTDPTTTVSSDEGITITVAVPFTPITPLVSPFTIASQVSGQTFPFQANVETPTPVASPGTATATPLATATALPTPTNAPAPTILSGPTITTCSDDCGSDHSSVTIAWTTDQTSSGNTVYIAPVGSSDFKAYTASAGTSATLTLTSRSEGDRSSYTYLESGTYSYYIESSTGTASTYAPACAPSCDGDGAYPTFDF